MMKGGQKSIKGPTQCSVPITSGLEICQMRSSSIISANGEGQRDTRREAPCALQSVGRTQGLLLTCWVVGSVQQPKQRCACRGGKGAFRDAIFVTLWLLVSARASRVDPPTLPQPPTETENPLHCRRDVPRTHRPGTELGRNPNVSVPSGPSPPKGHTPHGQ